MPAREPPAAPSLVKLSLVRRIQKCPDSLFDVLLKFHRANNTLQLIDCISSFFFFFTTDTFYIEISLQIAHIVEMQGRKGRAVWLMVLLVVSIFKIHCHHALQMVSWSPQNPACHSTSKQSLCVINNKNGWIYCTPVTNVLHCSSIFFTSNI